VRTLETWLDAQARIDAARARRWFLLLAGLFLVAAPLAWRMGETTTALTLGGAGGLALLVTLLADGTGRARAQAGASRSGFEALGLEEAPESWGPDSVRACLRRLRQRLADALQREREQQRLEQLDGAGVELERRERELAAERTELRRRLGIDPGDGDLSLDRIARAVAAYQAASVEHRKAQASQQEAGYEQAKLLRDVEQFVTEHGAATPVDPDAAAAAVSDLRERSRTLRETLERLRGEHRRCEEIEAQLATLRARRAEVYEGLGIDSGDTETLRRWLGHREVVSGLEADAGRLRGTIAELEGRLSDQPALRELTVEEIDRLRLESESIAAGKDELIEQRARTLEAVERARRGQELEEAREQEARARDALESRLEEALFKTAGRFLLEEVATQFDRQSRPEILARAAELFERFTHHRYALQIDTAEDRPAYRAVEVDSGVGQSPATLSDATRVQLLLAARLAFASQADRQTRLPMFLDEVLTTTDPERFAAVAESLLLFAREEDRQIVYLTANPSDVGQWNRVLEARGIDPVTTIDLAELRGLDSVLGSRDGLEVPPLEKVPLPAGVTAESYGARLGVPQVDLLRPVTALHLFYLLRDDLDLLYALLLRRIRTIGQWRQFDREGGGATLVGREAAERVSALADVAEAFFAASNVGRCRPIDIQVLLEAGLTDVWVEPLGSLLDELGGDPARFLDALECRDDPRTRGFRSRVRDRLRHHLVQSGHLDERTPLDESAIHARVQARVSDHVDRGRITAEQVATLVHELHHRGAKRV
jgi:hypothetical protein